MPSHSLCPTQYKVTTAKPNSIVNKHLVKNSDASYHYRSSDVNICLFALCAHLLQLLDDASEVLPKILIHGGDLLGVDIQRLVQLRHVGRPRLVPVHHLREGLGRGPQCVEPDGQFCSNIVGRFYTLNTLYASYFRTF